MSRVITRRERQVAYMDGVRDAYRHHVEHLTPARRPNPGTVARRYWQQGFRRAEAALVPILQALA